MQKNMSSQRGGKEGVRVMTEKQEWKEGKKEKETFEGYFCCLA